jgi:hypothetical protein
MQVFDLAATHGRIPRVGEGLPVVSYSPVDEQVQLVGSWVAAAHASAGEVGGDDSLQGGCVV